MRRSGASASKLLAAGGALALVAALPASGQETPQSLLPQGFTEDNAAPASPPPSTAAAEENVAADAVPTLALTVPEAPPEQKAEQPSDELPETSRRSAEIVGPLGPRDTGLGAAAFGGADGRFLTTLMRRIKGPVASRWASILLRRALLSQVPAPSSVHAVDWVAERALLLLRIGEADGARMLVQSIDVDRYTPRMYTVAAQTALATADPAALCPLAEVGGSLTDEPIWPVAQAICAGLSGDSAASGVMIDRARARRLGRPVDLQLAEKVLGAGIGGRRVVAVDWGGVEQLTSWRVGLAGATSTRIPDDLWSTVGPQVQAWRARTTTIPPEERLAPARAAAALGTMSSAALVDLYGAVAAETDPFALADSMPGQLGVAYAGEDRAARLAALHKLWGNAAGARDGYAMSILTARAAARIKPDGALGSDVASLVAAMLSSGLDRQAERWAPVIGDMSDADADRAWALLAVGAPDRVVPLGPGRVGDFIERAGGAGRHRSALLVAALAGLGRLDRARADALAQQTGFLLTESRWSRAIGVAAANRQPGTVALLAATGLQTRSWQGVPPAHLYHLIAALRAVGHDPEARMIAAEALSRT